MEKLLRQAEVGEQVEVSVATLRHWRAIGQGPPFLRLGRQIRYRPSDIEAWLNGQCHRAGDAA